MDQHWDTYREAYLAEPTLTLEPDAEGRVRLPRRVLTEAPPATSPPKAQVIILGVRTGQARGFAFLPVADLNRLYFQGGNWLQIPVAMQR